ncbi:MAG: phosphate acyltransferase PlsX [Eubacteriales bacterium]|nr:phosphate acyltransferase PlsX [Eubacteriales bacterium]
MKTRIIVDAMGGDNAPYSMVMGAVEGAREYKVDLIFVGDKNQIDPILKNLNTSGINIEVVHTQTWVEMTDHASVVQKEKRDSSVAVACDLLREGKGDAMISSGNTGALFTAATLFVRRHKGIRRSALGAIVNFENPFIIVDSGANIDVTPEILVQFAQMGNLYCQCVMGIPNPRVALLNNGTEETKGTQLYRDAYAILKNSNLNFIGNCEARDLTANFCDVVVCDGFTGNIALKLIEGMGQFLLKNLKKIYKKNLITGLSAILIKDSMADFKKRIDHREYGGAPFLGLSKPVIKSHGSAEPKSIMSTIRQARDYHLSGLIEKISEGITEAEEEKENGQ